MTPKMKTRDEPRCKKTGFFTYAKTKAQISFAVTVKLISNCIFVTRIVKFLFFLNLKFQASSLLLYLHRPVCVRPGRKLRRPVFSQRNSSTVEPSRVNVKINMFKIILFNIICI